MTGLTRRIIAAALTLACVLAWPATVGAEEEPNAIPALSVGATSFDMASHTPVVDVEFVCAADLWVRMGFTLAQHDAMPAGRPAAPDRPDRVNAVSVWYLDSLACTAGSTVEVAIRFVPQGGVFSPGRAEISGWVSSPYPAGWQSIAPTSIVLHPTR